jgi:large subunit ribosomal protein L10
MPPIRVLRRKCFDKSINLVVVKNTLLRKALEGSEKNFEEIYDVLKDSTSIMFSESGNVPAKLIKEFRKKHDRPVLKAAYIEQSFYFGDDQVEMLSTLKTRDELIGDIMLITTIALQTTLFLLLNRAE